MICVSISSLHQLPGVIDSGVSLIELRLDLIGEEPDRIYHMIPGHVKTIATCRPEDYSDPDRIQLLQACMDLGAAYIDLEIESTESYLESLIAYARRSGTITILSYHNFKTTPDVKELEQILGRCYERGADVAKIAVQINTPLELNTLLGLYRLPGKKVVLGMGKLGRISRVAGPYLGAEFTFGSPGNGSETAPGQISYSQLKDIYKVIDES